MGLMRVLSEGPGFRGNPEAVKTPELRSIPENIVGVPGFLIRMM